MTAPLLLQWFLKQSKPSWLFNINTEYHYFADVREVDELSHVSISEASSFPTTKRSWRCPRRFSCVKELFQGINTWDGHSLLGIDWNGVFSLFSVADTEVDVIGNWQKKWKEMRKEIVHDRMQESESLQSEWNDDDDDVTAETRTNGRSGRGNSMRWNEEGGAGVSEAVRERFNLYEYRRKSAGDKIPHNHKTVQLSRKEHMRAGGI